MINFQTQWTMFKGTQPRDLIIGNWLLKIKKASSHLEAGFNQLELEIYFLINLPVNTI